jgi:hypothetical protein
MEDDLLNLSTCLLQSHGNSSCQKEEPFLPLWEAGTACFEDLGVVSIFKNTSSLHNLFQNFS